MPCRLFFYSIIPYTTMFNSWNDLALCVNLTQARVVTEKGASLEEMPP